MGLFYFKGSNFKRIIIIPVQSYALVDCFFSTLPHKQFILVEFIQFTLDLIPSHTLKTICTVRAGCVLFKAENANTNKSQITKNKIKKK